MEIARFWGVTTPKPLNQLIKNFVWVSGNSLMPKFKMIAPLGALQDMREIHCIPIAFLEG